MAQQHYKALFKKALLQFITELDPFLTMLKWVMTEMMRIEVEAKVRAAKGSTRRTGQLIFPAGGLSVRTAELPPEPGQSPSPPLATPSIRNPRSPRPLLGPPAQRHGRA
jgi:hypothetical protein